jgi:alpha-amylase/alpha-mannosidase (GH57 family)
MLGFKIQDGLRVLDFLFRACAFPEESMVESLASQRKEAEKLLQNALVKEERASAAWEAAEKKFAGKAGEDARILEGLEEKLREAEEAVEKVQAEAHEVEDKWEGLWTEEGRIVKELMSASVLKMVDDVATRTFGDAWKMMGSKMPSYRAALQKYAGDIKGTLKACCGKDEELSDEGIMVRNAMPAKLRYLFAPQMDGSHPLPLMTEQTILRMAEFLSKCTESWKEVSGLSESRVRRTRRKRIQRVTHCCHNVLRFRRVL